MHWACAVLMITVTSPLAAADLSDTAASRTRFIARHRCAIVEHLEIMHQRGPIEESRDRFIIVALRGAPQRYVQCIFQDRDTRMFCEASSGAYGPTGEGRLQLGPPERAALNALGYVQASPSKNSARDVVIGDPPDVTIAADLMLAALHDGYGAGPGSVIEIQAPSGDDPVVACGTPAS
ncbi:hypothetical protein [Methylobacterium sp. GC_Met_2]|uniref:TY-Chap domain-containing protein n=1 Tax=Methylobacterium sp. GC_Met_2 TaxID=2937376 RepID=UPI00226B5028|nr:hypothetical protein [Methylobacterium sp. GC_Met_2]